jgi:cobalt-zinc-cadmium efflux system outer membrane protein
MRRLGRLSTLALGAPLALSASLVWAQADPGVAGPQATTLKQAYEAAWARQPEARSLDARRDAAAARLESADSWLAEPPALELSGKSDRATGNDGDREYVAGIALPLWLPGERSRTAALAEAEARGAQSRTLGAQLRVAASVRESWWAWQRALGEQALARERLANARQLASDVARRVQAGDLARSDQHQADGAAASAEMALAEAEGALAAATQHLRALTGLAPGDAAELTMEPLPPLPSDLAALDATHPAVIELADRADAARKSADLAGVQTRGNPELTLAATRERSVAGESWDQSLTLGVRIPFGAGSRHRAKSAAARAEAIEAESQAQLARERLVSDLETARVRVESARAQLAAAEKRTRLARESRGFFEKSFRLGETDLPSRLRVELEASEADRQASRARIDLAAAVSAFRQALGLLPEQGAQR